MADASMSPGQDVVALVMYYSSLWGRFIVGARLQRQREHAPFDSLISGFTLLSFIILEHAGVRFPQFS